jgi:hypothetical protein
MVCSMIALPYWCANAALQPQELLIVYGELALEFASRLMPEHTDIPSIPLG